MNLFLRYFLIVLLSACYTIFGAVVPPNISPYEAYAKSEEIFRAHARHKEFNAEIANRVIINYLEELDPAKCYFTQTDLAIYLNPSNELLNQIVVEYQKQQFTTFQVLYDTFLNAIDRREALELAIQEAPLPANVKSKDLHDAP